MTAAERAVAWLVLAARLARSRGVSDAEITAAVAAHAPIDRCGDDTCTEEHGR